MLAGVLEPYEQATLAQVAQLKAEQELENQDIRLLSQITHPNGREVGDWGLMTNQEWWRTLRDRMRAAGLLQPDSLELIPKYAMGGW